MFLRVFREVVGMFCLQLVYVPYHLAVRKFWMAYMINRGQRAIGPPDLAPSILQPFESLLLFLLASC